MSRPAGAVCLALFVALLLGLPILAASGWQPFRLMDAFYRSGALVFGGGHVVLPLLENEVVRSGWVAADDFLAGYGAAQAIPGPLFSFAAYLGFVSAVPPNGLLGAAIALPMIFLPGMLLLVGVIPFWDRLRRQPRAQAALAGTNAAVVGILGAALYDPVWTSAVGSIGDFALVTAGFLALVVWKAPPWLVVVLMAAAGLAATLV